MRGVVKHHFLECSEFPCILAVEGFVATGGCPSLPVAPQQVSEDYTLLAVTPVFGDARDVEVARRFQLRALDVAASIRSQGW